MHAAVFEPWSNVFQVSRRNIIRRKLWNRRRMDMLLRKLSQYSGDLCHTARTFSCMLEAKLANVVVGAAFRA